MAKYDLTSKAVQDQAEKAKEGFSLLPEGKHLMRCTGVTHKVINDKDAWDLDLEVVKGEPNEMEKCRDTLFFTEKALGRIFLVMTAFGCKESDLASIDPESKASQKLIQGRRAIVEVEHSDPDPKGRIWANPTYAGYEVAHRGAVEAHQAGEESKPAEDDDLPF